MEPNFTGTKQRVNKIVIAPDSYKGYLTAKQAAAAMKQGCADVFGQANYQLIPMADGGEGTVSTLVEANQGTLVETQVANPFGETVSAQYGLIDNGRTAVIEMAAASGFQFINPKINRVGEASTFGTGQLIEAALNQGVSKIILGLGGSATNDGGAGMAVALGAKLLDSSGELIEMGGADLARLAKIDITDFDMRLTEVEIIGATDVTNPLTGSQGATEVFGRQKGATDQQVIQLDSALKRYAKVIYSDLGIDVDQIAGAGAAGGLGAGMLAFLHAKLTSGIDLVMKETGFLQKIKGANIVLTGEGAIDFQTQFGKAPSIVAQEAKAINPDCMVIGIGGKVGDDLGPLYNLGFDYIVPVTVDSHLGDPKINAAKNLESTIAAIIRQLN